MAGQIFWLFCAQYVAGSLLLLPLVPIGVVGRSFYKINLRIAFSMALLGLCVWLIGLGRSVLLGGAMPRVSGFEYGTLAATLLTLIVTQLTLNVVSGQAFQNCYGRLRLAAIFACLGLLLLIAEQVSLAAKVPTILRYLTIPALFCGAGLMGSVTLSMILGHYYLNSPKLAIEPLQTYHLALLWSASLRAAIFVAGLTLCSLIEMPSAGADRGFFLENTLLLIQRSLFGILGPSLLAWMSWETAKISEPHEAKVQATQSATGILYGNMVLIAIGELVALYFQTSQGIAI